MTEYITYDFQCIENVSRANCPICQEDIHTSREPSQIPPCNHLIHKTCFEQLINSGRYNCPFCQRSLVDMTEMWQLYDQKIKESPHLPPYDVSDTECKFTQPLLPE